MILYFSGTGNSAYAAKRAAEELQDDILDLHNMIKNNDYSPMTSDRPWIIAAPVYCWQLPHIVRDWMLKTEFRGSREVYFIMTCGGDMGNGEKYLRKLCHQKGLEFKGVAEIVMPENYIALFSVPDERESEIIIKRADGNLKRAIDVIKEGKELPPVKAGIIGRFSSSIVNKVYYPLIVKDRKFYAEDNCSGCGLCVKKCPLNNIRLVGGKPEWMGNCTHCMACISYCPEEAIEYGNGSKGKRRYRLEK